MRLSGLLNKGHYSGVKVEGWLFYGKALFRSLETLGLDRQQ